MPWFKIYGKSYLLSKEERQRQLRVQRERRSPLNPRRRDDGAGPSTAPTQSLDLSTAPIQSPSPATTPTQSPGLTLEPTIPTAQSFQMMPCAYHSPFIGPPMYRPPSHEGSHEGPSGSSSFYQSQSPYGF
ncbi:hypothetical protein Godav_021833 [Gossypium davidsonii]|uniref:Uncharacterized protein n=1 Tax=Gossypium davidsonii TaxID=34287 RepID=A0A7J8T9K9_GOSDV|nr:hypothetical protein [Gossypium davidsonii]